MAGLESLWMLEGAWSLERVIAHVGGDENLLQGRAVFHREGARLIQDESGTLQIGAQRMAAARRYIWAEGEGQLDVFFDDMRAFHSVALNVTCHEAVHLCDPDRYAVAYDFSAWPNWSARWRVQGPRKDYVMTSRYTPHARSLAP